MSDADLLQARGISKRFGGVHAVRGMDITVRREEVVGLIGPNGAGKSTLFHCLSGYHRPDAGTVVFDGHDITGWPLHRTAKQGLVRTFQLESVLQRMSVLENLMLAGVDQTGETLTGVFSPRVRKQEADIAAEAHEALAFLRLDHLADEYAGNLSGGQKKLLDLARALMLRPRLLLLDEPMAGVNPSLRRDLIGRIEALRDDRGMTVLLVEHDMQTVFGHCDRVVVMAEGRFLTEGTPEDVRNDPRVREAYLGT